SRNDPCVGVAAPAPRRGGRAHLRSAVVSGPTFSRASGIAWKDYYSAVEGRPLRPLFIEAAAFLPSMPDSEQVRVAVDLGCGDGSESLALLVRGWKVLAVDRAPEAIALLQASVPPEAAVTLTPVVG